MNHVLGPAPHTIPAHPLAVDANGQPDWAAQRLLSRYYVAAGATGLAVGVHTTQFEIHDDRDLYRRVLTEAADVAKEFGPGVRLVAGIAGDVDVAVEEAEIAKELGYVAGLMCSYGLTDRSESTRLTRGRTVAEVLPILGFYMQESVGGQYLSPDYWQQLLEIEGLVGIKAAPFDRYRTNDVAAQIAQSGRTDIALMTGNDDTIVLDLMTPYRFDDQSELRFTGGLLGQWAVGTKAAVNLTQRIWDGHSSPVPQDVLAAGAAITDINQAIFDPEHSFAGSIAGVNELLRQQGLLSSSRCLSDREVLAEGQAEKIQKVRARYPELVDDAFIADNIDKWRRDVA